MTTIPAPGTGLRPRASRRRRPGVALLLIAVLGLAACGGEHPAPSRSVAGSLPSHGTEQQPRATKPVHDRASTPRTDGDTSASAPTGSPAAATVAHLDAHLPLTWTTSTVRLPGWSELPDHADGVFLGFAAPEEDRAALRFFAVDDRGTVLWHADRPATCTGYALSRTGDGPVAVLTDLRADGPPMQTTASGFDLVTGDRLWGPVPVPGSLQGPGLVFAAPAPASALGSTGPRVALDSASGRIVADERSDPGTHIVGEYDGIIVTADGSGLHAVDASSGHRTWTVENPDDTSAMAPPGVRAPAGTALITSGPAAAATLIDLGSGEIIARTVSDAALDPLSGTYLVLDGSTLTGITPGDDPWHQQVPQGSRIVAAGSGLVYVLSNGVGRVINALTGRAAGAYAPEVTTRFAVPQAISATGAAVFRVDGRILLATVPSG